MQGTSRAPIITSTPTQDRMQPRRESLEGINMTPVTSTNETGSGSRSEPATPAPSAPERMDTSISMETVGFQPIASDFNDMHCPACFETDWTTRAHIFAECGHRYHMDCFMKYRNMHEGHPRCAYCNRYLFTPPANVLVDNRGIRVPSPPPDPRARQRSIDQTRELQEHFDAADRGEEGWPPGMDELLDSPPERAPQPRVPPSSAPQDGTYHEPNARGEIPFTPNENYGNNSRAEVSTLSQSSQSTGSNSTVNSTARSPYRPGCRIISRRVNESFSQHGGGIEYLVLVENVDGSRRTWKEYHPSGAPRLRDIVNGQEVPPNAQADRPRTPRGSDPMFGPHTAASADRPRTPRGTVHEDAATAAESAMDDAVSTAEPRMDDAASAAEPQIADDEIQVVQHVVGNAGVIVVDVEVEHPDYEDDNDSEPIGLAALEQMGIDDDEEEQEAAAAAIVDVDVDAVDAEAAQYLAEVEGNNGEAAVAAGAAGAVDTVDAEEQFRAELETGAGMEPAVPEPRDDEGTDSIPELERMEDE